MLKRKRKQSPIARLPDEVLAEIFLWHIEAACASADLKPYLDEQPLWILHCATRPSTTPVTVKGNWLAVRQVCRRWRRITMSYPTLSAHIPLTELECVKQLLRTAGVLPLHVYNHHTMRLTALQCSGLVLVHIERIVYGSLVVPENPSFKRAQGQTYITSRAQSLCLDFSVRLAASDVFATVSFPELKQLACYRSNNITSLRALLVPSLVHLCLSHCNIGSLVQLLAFLQTMERLQDLKMKYLTYVDPSFLFQTPRHDSVTTLPRLQSLTISGNTSLDSLNLLRHIAHPASTAIHLTCADMHEDYAPGLASLASRTSAWQSLDGPPVQSLRIDAAHVMLDVGVCITLWRERLPLAALQDPGAQPPPFFTLSSASCSTWLLRRLCRVLPLSHVCTAAIADAASLWGVLDWAALCKALSGVEALALRYEVLSREASRMAPLPAPLFPALRQLHVQECRLRKGYLTLGSSEPAHEPLVRIARALLERDQLSCGGDGDTHDVRVELVNRAGVAKRLVTPQELTQTSARGVAARLAQFPASCKRPLLRYIQNKDHSL